MDDVLEDDPSRSKLLGKAERLHRSRPAFLGSWLRALRASVVCTFGRRQKEFNIADFIFQSARVEFFKSRRFDDGLWEIASKSARGDIPHIDAAHDFRSSHSGARAAQASAAKKVQRPHPIGALPGCRTGDQAP
jgi:hypothetical protein